MRRRDAIGTLVVSLFLIALGVWSLVDASVTGEMRIPRSGGETARSGDTEFGLLSLLYMAEILAGVAGLFVYVTQYLGRSRGL